MSSTELPSVKHVLRCALSWEKDSFNLPQFKIHITSEPPHDDSINLTEKPQPPARSEPQTIGASGSFILFCCWNTSNWRRYKAIGDCQSQVACCPVCVGDRAKWSRSRYTTLEDMGERRGGPQKAGDKDGRVGLLLEDWGHPPCGGWGWMRLDEAVPLWDVGWECKTW